MTLGEGKVRFEFFRGMTEVGGVAHPATYIVLQCTRAKFQQRQFVYSLLADVVIRLLS